MSTDVKEVLDDIRASVGIIKENDQDPHDYSLVIGPVTYNALLAHLHNECGVPIGILKKWDGLTVMPVPNTEDAYDLTFTIGPTVMLQEAIAKKYLN